MTTQPARSFNLDKLLKSHITPNNGLLLSGDRNTTIQFGSTQDFTLTNVFSLEAKFSIPSGFNTGAGYIVDMLDERENGLSLVVESGVHLSLYTGDNSSYKHFSYSGLSANTDYTVFINGINNQISMYVNGTKYTTSSITIGRFYPIFGKTTFTSHTDSVDLNIEFVKIWNKPAFDDQILTSYNNSSDVYPITSSKGYWNFYNRVDKLIIDNSPNGNYGLVDTHITNNLTTDISPAWKILPTTQAYINNNTFPNYIANKDYAFSIDGWMYIDEDSVSNQINILKYANNGDVDNPISFGVNTSKQLYADIVDRSGNSFNLTSSNTVDVKKWTHVAFTFEPGQTEYSLSIDGNIETSNTLTIPSGLNLTTISGLFFGDTKSLNVMFRNWKVYETKLTSDELTKAYKYTTEYPVSQQYLVAEWKFQEECVGWAYDCSDHGNYLYPITGSGLSSSNQILAEYVQKSGFYPEMWDGYSYASTATDIYGDHINNVDEPELIFNDNSVLEVLFFNAYDDWTRGLNDPGLADIPTNSFPLGIYYGPYIVTTDSNYTNYIQQYVYHSGLGITTAVFSNYAREIPYTNAEILSARDGKWHHVIAMHSIYETISGTNYNAAIYHNGKLAGVYEYFTHTGLHALNTGKLALGHYLNGSVAIARVYSPTTSGMVDWFNGTNVLFTPGFSVTDCSYTSTAENNLLFDANFDYTSQNISNNSNAFDRTYSLRTYSPLGSPGVSISKIPLNHRYFSVADTIPDVPTPKFAITDIEHDGEYSLECYFKISSQASNTVIDVITSDYLNFATASGIYIATMTPTITVSGVFYYDEWNHIAFRYQDNIASFLINLEEVYSGISNDWSSPQETVKWGFYANAPTKHSYINVKRIAAYDQWLPENSMIENSEQQYTISKYEMKYDLVNYRTSQKT